MTAKPRALESAQAPKNAKRARREPGSGAATEAAFGSYLQELKRNALPLLTPKEELELGRKLDRHIRKAVRNMLQDIKEAEAILKQEGGDTLLRWRAGRCLLRLNPKGQLGRKLEAELLARMRTTEADDLFKLYAEPEGLALRDRFAESNLRLVITIARKYDHGILPLAELVQEGNAGLLHSVLRYDYRRGLRFSTYATWWIRHAIGRAISDKGYDIRIPVHMREDAAKFNKLRLAMERPLGQAPTDEELAAELRARDRREGRQPMSFNGQLKKIQSLEHNPRIPVSFDQPTRTDDGEAGTGTLYDQLTGEPEETLPWTPLRDGVDTGRLAAALARLTPMEREVIGKRFGLADDVERTFEEIGSKYRLSRERMRQIQNRALEKLRHDPNLKPLVQELRAQAL